MSSANPPRDPLPPGGRKRLDAVRFALDEREPRSGASAGAMASFRLLEGRRADGAYGRSTATPGISSAARRWRIKPAAARSGG
ncbi:MAG: hypothetical protein M5R42_15245 [Rhodocyclaceae bacterium]|nr:hypothetical protein [Rhodocyclaceae bacterium]